MINRSNETSPTLALGRLEANFRDTDPDRIFQMATRIWPNVTINGAMYEVQTTFYSTEMSDLDHQLVSWFCASFDNHTFLTWVSSVGDRLVNGTLTHDWFKNQTLNRAFMDRFQVDFWCVATLASHLPGPQDDQALHLCFVLYRT